MNRNGLSRARGTTAHPNDSDSIAIAPAAALQEGRAPASASRVIRCHSAGRLRDFFRNRILLAGWRPDALPAAPSAAAADQALDLLAGPPLRQQMTQALDQADQLAKRIGGCARDAYTVLYGCAAVAVLFAACGVAAAADGVMIDLLVMAELATLLILFLTFRNAHRVNWHSRWLGLRFHAEFLRCLPVMVAARAASPLEPAMQAQRKEEGALPPREASYLRALAGGAHNAEDHRAVAHENEQCGLRTRLYEQLRAAYLKDPPVYAGNALSHARLLAQQQLRYHCLRAQQEQAIVHRAHFLSIAAFGVTIVAVLAHFWWHSPVLTIICTGVPAFAASLHGFLAQEESERLAASYRLMAHRLHDWLQTGIGDGGDLPQLQTHLAELVGLMMSEVQDWHRLFGNKAMYHLG